MKNQTPILISSRQVEDLKNRFYTYVQQFKRGADLCTENAILKENHTIRVCNEILSIGSSLELTADKMRLAEITALFHDIGRFEQYARFKTFSDGKSVNHAALGVEILKKNKVLKDVDPFVQDLVCRIIDYHNRAALPADETPNCLFFAKLLRDADKLDIWRVVTRYYEDSNCRRNPALELDLPDTDEISENVYRSLINHRIVDFKYVKNLNDFKLLQAGWVFDIHFEQTLYAVFARKYLDIIERALPDSEKIREIFDMVRHYLLQKLTIKP